MDGRPAECVGPGRGGFPRRIRQEFGELVQDAALVRRIQMLHAFRLAIMVDLEAWRLGGQEVKMLGEAKRLKN